MRKSFRREKKQHQSGNTDIHIPKETIHVEKNLIIDWVLRLKSIINHNRKFLKNIFIVVIISGVISGIFIFLYTSLTKKHNYLFFTYLEEYEELKKDKPKKDEKTQEAQKSQKERKNKLTLLAENSHKLCHTFLKTPNSYNACLIEAVSYIELEQPEKASESLNLFGEYNSHKGAGAYILFFAAQAYESLLNYKKAYNIYHKLEEILKPIKKDDIAIFHKGKILLLQNKLDLAEDMFYRIINDFPTSQFLQDAKSFLKLVALRKHDILNATSD